MKKILLGIIALFMAVTVNASTAENVTYIKIEDIKVTLKENIGYNEKLRIDYKINPLDASNTKLVWSVSGLKNGISAEFETNTETTKEEGTIKINLKNSLDEEVTLKLIAKQDDKVVSETTLKVEAKNTTIERVTKEVKEAINKLDTNLTKKNYEENKELLNEINDALEKVEMLDFKNKDLYNLSLGQKQRIMIAEILAKNPKYLIFDEPTTMIDSIGKEKIYKIIKNLKQQGYTIICITNLADEILLADRTLVLEQGKIALEVVNISI